MPWWRRRFCATNAPSTGFSTCAGCTARTWRIAPFALGTAAKAVRSTTPTQAAGIVGPGGAQAFVPTLFAEARRNGAPMPVFAGVRRGSPDVMPAGIPEDAAQTLSGIMAAGRRLNAPALLG